MAFDLVASLKAALTKAEAEAEAKAKTKVQAEVETGTNATDPKKTNPPLPCVLLTRPYEDSQKLAGLLHQSGFQTIVSPMLTLSFPHLPPEEVLGIRQTPWAGILLTSRHGVQALAKIFPDAQYKGPLFTVGSTTAAACHQAGFQTIVPGKDSALSMLPLLEAYFREHGPPPRPTSPLLYLRGQDVHFNLTAALTAKGIPVKEVMTYTAQAAKSLTPQASDALQKGLITDVVFYSQRSMQLFFQFLQPLYEASFSEHPLPPFRVHAISPPLLAAAKKAREALFFKKGA